MWNFCSYHSGTNKLTQCFVKVDVLEEYWREVYNKSSTGAFPSFFSDFSECWWKCSCISITILHWLDNILTFSAACIQIGSIILIVKPQMYLIFFFSPPLAKTKTKIKLKLWKRFIGMVLLSASVKRFSVSRMQDFSLISLLYFVLPVILLILFATLLNFR